MFKFNFNDVENEETDSRESEKSHIKWYECEKVDVPEDTSNLLTLASQVEPSVIKYGKELTFTCFPAGEVMNLLKKRTDAEEFLDVVQADEQHSDLVSGKYEGGLKTWECTKDLALFIQENVIQKSENLLNGKKVLDLGCGTGLLGILCLQNGGYVTFQDYNKEVLQMMTMPNVFLNCKGEITKKMDFYCGDWSSFVDVFNKEGDLNKFDYILTSETIYNVENYDKLIKVFKNLLHSDGIAYVAAKSHYFGVGGTLFEFMGKLQSNNFNCNVVWESGQGVSRKILKVEAGKCE